MKHFGNDMYNFCFMIRHFKLFCIKKYRSRVSYLVHFVFVAVIFGSCGEDDVIQKMYAFPKNEWHREQVPLFEFTITALNQPYDLILVLNNTVVYPYQNLHIQYCLEGEETSKSAFIELCLFDKKTGQPLGYGSGDSRSHRLCFISNYTFKKEGTYKVQLAHFMRKKVLGGIKCLELTVKPTFLS